MRIAINLFSAIKTQLLLQFREIVGRGEIRLDEAYQEYINRVARQTLPASHSNQLKSIQASPKFAEGKPTPFPGYTIITPLREEDLTNAEFYTYLETLQQELLQQIDTNTLVLLPPETFHLTLADLIWENAYSQAVAENRNFEQDLRQEIQLTFDQYQQDLNVDKPIAWQLLGLVIRPRALLACLVPKDRESYEAILQLRRSIYQNGKLIGLGIEQQYDYTAHVTLGYFGDMASERLGNPFIITISQINDRLVETQEQVLTINQVQLRKFDNMIHYYREPGWAIIEF